MVHLIQRCFHLMEFSDKNTKYKFGTCVITTTMEQPTYTGKQKISVWNGCCTGSTTNCPLGG